MTIETMVQVAAELTRRGLPSTCEYPGYVDIYADATGHYVLGDGDTYVVINMVDEADGWNEITLAESETPIDTTDYERVAGFAIAVIRATVAV